MVEAVEIDTVLLRVGVYGAVGIFLLGAGYLYRVRRVDGQLVEDGSSSTVRTPT
jgi:hypothetical protein